MMSHVPVWNTAYFNDDMVVYSLDELKKTTSFLLEQSEEDRFHLIMMYDKYAQSRSDKLATSSKLYLLLRVLFDVSETYPAEDARFFAGWGTLPEPRSTDKEINLLWPIGYKNQQLVLKAIPLAHLGVPYYDGLGEYKYFAASFPLRDRDELK